MARLFLGAVDKVRGGLKRRPPSTLKAGTELANLLTSLRNHRHRSAYPSPRHGGSPLSRGGSESAHKVLCPVRLNRSGAWGYVAKGNHLLALRCAKYKGPFARVLGRYQQKILTKSQQKNVKK